MILSQDENGYFTKFEGGSFLGFVHPEAACSGRGCAIHNHPSAHPLAFAPMNWRSDKGFLERICIHGIGHPDADSTAYLRSVNEYDFSVHACDGCC